VPIRKAISKYTSSTQAKSVAKVISGNLATSLISLVTSIFVARWTTPHDMGLWNFVLLISVYTPILQLGIFNGLNRQLPYYMGRGEQEKSLTMASVAYAWGKILTLLSSLFTILSALWYWQAGQTNYCYTAIAIGIIIISSWPAHYLTVTYRTNEEFGRLAKKNTAVALISVPLTLLVLYFGYVGLMTRAALVAILGAAALYFRRPIKVVAKWDISILIQLLRIGFPIWFLGQLGTMFLTLDRIVLADSPTNLGYFSISIQASAFASMIPIAITTVLYPQMVHKYGETNNAIAAWNIAKNGAVIATVLGAVAGVCGWILVPIFIKMLLPAYVPGTSAAQWASLTGLALGLSVFNNIFNVIKRQDIYLITMGIGLATFFGMWFSLTKSYGRDEIVSAVQAMLTANLTMSISSLIITRVVCVRHDMITATAAKTGTKSLII
jgi:O-antigen/teichoic acid export membrane protein